MTHLIRRLCEEDRELFLSLSLSLSFSPLIEPGRCGLRAL